jgi:hypothetical protein
MSLHSGDLIPSIRNFGAASPLVTQTDERAEDNMSFGKGALLWLIGIPLPIILLLAFFWH